MISLQTLKKWDVSMVYKHCRTYTRYEMKWNKPMVEEYKEKYRHKSYILNVTVIYRIYLNAMNRTYPM